jgi:hypothetical protein
LTTVNEWSADLRNTKDALPAKIGERQRVEEVLRAYLCQHFELGLTDRIIIGYVRTYGFVARISRETPGASSRGVLKVTIFHEQTVVNFLGAG